MDRRSSLCSRALWRGNECSSQASRAWVSHVALFFVFGKLVYLKQFQVILLLSVHLCFFVFLVRSINMY